MRMSFENLNRVARGLVEVLRERGLASAKDLQRAVGEAFDPGESGDGFEWVDVGRHPSGRGFVIGYRRRNGQAPIMVIAEPGVSYKLMVTALEPLDGYAVFDEEPEFGLMQEKKVSGDFAALLAALEALATAKPKPAAAGAAGRVRPSGRDMELVCSVCGGRAARFQMGMYPGDDHYVYFDREDRQTCVFSGSDSEAMAPLLAAGDLRGLRKYILEESVAAPELDAYCPECDAAFCKKHLDAGGGKRGKGKGKGKGKGSGEGGATVACPAGHDRTVKR